MSSINYAVLQIYESYCTVKRKSLLVMPRTTWPVLQLPHFMAVGEDVIHVLQILFFNCYG